MPIQKVLRRQMDAAGQVVTGLPEPVAASDAATKTFAEAGGVGAHTHAQSDVTGLAAALAAKQDTSAKGQANGYASLGAGGLVPVAQLGTGTPDGTKFLRDDGVFAAPAGGGGATALALPYQGGDLSNELGVTTETVIAEAVVDFGDLTGSNVAVKAAFLSRVTGGQGTLRVRAGGTPGAADGTVLLASAAFTETTNTAKSASATVAKPSGLQLVKLTVQQNTSSEVAFVRGFNVVLKGA